METQTTINEKEILRKERHARNEYRRRQSLSSEGKAQLKIVNYQWRQEVNNHKIGCKRNFKCKNNLAGNSRYCFEHWLDRAYVSKSRFEVTVEELKNLWDKQEGKCAISKCILIPGINVALDHIIPREKNGTNTIENLRFINYNVNLLKHKMTDNELKNVLNEIGPSLMEWAQGE